MAWIDDMSDLGDAEAEAFGEEVTYSTVLSLGYDFTTGVPTNASSTYTVTAHVGQERSDPIERGKHQERVFTILASELAAVTPKLGHTITYGGKVFRITAIERILGSLAYQFTGQRSG